MAGKTVLKISAVELMNHQTLAAPVLLGMMLNEAALPPLQSLLDGPSTVFWVAMSKEVSRKQTKLVHQKNHLKSCSFLYLFG